MTRPGSCRGGTMGIRLQVSTSGGQSPGLCVVCRTLPFIVPPYFCSHFRFLLCTMLAVQFVMSVATEEGCHMAAKTFGINYLASDTV